MRRFIKLLCPLIFVSLFISCSRDVQPQGTITFDITNAAKKITKNARTAEEAELDDSYEEFMTIDLSLKVKTEGDYETEYTADLDITDLFFAADDLTDEDAEKFYGTLKPVVLEEIPVGSKISVSAELIIDIQFTLPEIQELFKEFAIDFTESSKCEGKSGVFEVQPGENQISIPMHFTGDSDKDKEEDKENEEETEEDTAINLIMSELLKELKTATPVAQTTGTASGYEGSFTLKLYEDSLYTIEYAPVGIVSVGSYFNPNNALMIFEIFYYDTTSKKFKSNKTFVDHFLNDDSEYHGQSDEELASWLTEDIFNNSVIAIQDATKTFTLKGKSGIEITFNYLFKTYPVSGEIEINNPKLTIGINDDASTVKIEQNKITAYLNYNTIKFSLNDENNTDIISDNLSASNAAGWTYKLTYQGKELSSTTYYTTAAGVITLGSLPREGTYQLYVQANPVASGYEGCAMVSGTFEFEFVNYAYYSYSVDSNAGDDYIDFNKDSPVENLARKTIQEATTNVYLHLYGEYSSQMSTLFGSYFRDFMFYNFGDKSNKFMIDASEVTAQDTIFSSNAFRDLNMIKSIILPDTATSYLMAIFQQNTSLEYVKFGAATNNLGEMSISDNTSSLFQGCTNLKKVEFANTEGWYSAPESVRTDLIDWSSLTVPKYDNLNQPVTEYGNPVYIILTAVDVSDPEANANHIKNGSWGYLYRKTE